MSFISDEVRSVGRKADVLLLESRELSQSGPILRIVHRFCEHGTECRAGEEVWAVLLVVRGQEVPVRLTLALRLLIDYLAKTRHVPQSASQIAAGIRISEFWSRHGANSGTVSRRKFARSSIKEYIKRIRCSLEMAFGALSIHLDANRVLLSRVTAGNEKLYQLRARVEWVHI